MRDSAPKLFKTRCFHDLLGKLGWLPAGRSLDAGGSPAHLAFREAEAMQQEWQPQYPLLYSLQGYQYCELLLADVCLRIRGVRFQLASSGEECRPDQAQRRSGNEECERQGDSRRFDEATTQEEPAAGAMPLTEENVTEGAPAALGSVRPAGDSGEDRKLEAYATAARELQSEIESLRNRAETTLKIAETALTGILNRALDHLTLGRTWQLSALLECGDWSPLSLSSPGESADQERSEIRADREIQSGDESPHSKAEQHLTESITLLREAGTQHHLPRGLLHRAVLWREMLEAACGWPRLIATGVAERQEVSEADVATSRGSATQVDEQPVPPEVEELLANAERDLSEAEKIAERGSMLIFRIEAALERTRLFLTLHHAGLERKDPATGWLAMAREKLEETRKLIKETESKYESHVPDWPEWKPPEYVGVFKKGDTVGYHCHNEEIEQLQTAIDLATKSDRSAAGE